MTAVFFLTYFALRVFSYFFSPDTPLYAANPVNSLVAGLILVIAVYFLIKKDVRGWLIVAGEIILGGGGGYLAIQGISLRTCLLIVSLTIFFIQKIKDKRYEILKENRIISYLLSLILIWVLFSSLSGLYYGHNLKLVFSDFIPYLFLLYYFPLRELWKNEKFKQVVLPMLIAAVLGNAIFILITFAGFSSGLLTLQDSYYHWFRDVAGGKITDLGFNFYRLILNEHLLLVPLLLFFVNKCLKERVWLCWLLLLALTITLSVNFTRIYFVALFVGLLFLFTRLNWKKWLLYSAGTLVLLFGSFTALHLTASRGQNLGWELWGLRIQSVVSPQIEESSLSRMLLLPKIWEKIKNHPILGEGLGATITVYSPVLKQTVTTPHLDWGYLEIIAEMGLIGLAFWLAFVIYLLKESREKFILATLAALLVINLTSPALFHVLGIIWLAFALSKITLNRAFVTQFPSRPRIL